MFQARWAYDGSAQGGKKIAFGNTWVVAAIVVRLPFCSFPVALPVLFRLWRGKGTASPVELAAEMLKLLAAAFPGGPVHGTGDAAFHGERWRRRHHVDDQAAVKRGAVRAEAAAHRQARPSGGQGRPAGHLRRGRAAADWQYAVIHVYGEDTAVQIASCEALWYGSFKSAPGQLVLVREPGSRKPYDLGLLNLDTSASPAAIAERYSWRWPIEPSNATGKQILGVGDACNRAEKPVQRTVPFGFLIQALLIIWYARWAWDPADIDRRRQLCPWYRTKTEPSAADMLARLRREFLKARFPPTAQATATTIKSTTGVWTCDTAAA